MKKLLFLLLFFVGFSSVAQTYVEKYNPLNNRYEYFDKQTNKMVAYKSYNSLNGTWETTYVNNNNQQGSGRYIPQKQRTDDNFALLQQVMAEKQAKFDANYQRIQEHINTFSMKTAIATDERKVAVKIMDDFNSKCVKSLNGRNYDFSSNSKTIEVMNYLTDCHNQTIKRIKFDVNYQKVQEHINSFSKKASENTDNKLINQIKNNFTTKCAKPIKDKKYNYSNDAKTNEIINYLTNCYDQVVAEIKSNTNSSTNLSSQSKATNNSDSPLIDGGYKTNQILEYQYNSKTKKYDLIFDEKISSELIFKADSIYFKRGKDDWKGAKWFYQGFNEDSKQHIFFDDYNQTITFDKNFDIISWYAEPKDNVFQKIYIYKYLTKFDIIYTTN